MVLQSASIPVESSYNFSFQVLSVAYLVLACLVPLLANCVYQVADRATKDWQAMGNQHIIAPIRPYGGDPGGLKIRSLRKCVEGAVKALVFLQAFSFSSGNFKSVNLYHTVVQQSKTRNLTQGYLAPVELSDPSSKGCYLFDVPSAKRYEDCSSSLQKLHNMTHLSSAADAWKKQSCSSMELILLEAVLRDTSVFLPLIQQTPDGPLRPQYDLKKSVTKIHAPLRVTRGQDPKQNEMLKKRVPISMSSLMIGTHRDVAVAGGSGSGATVDVSIVDPTGTVIEDIDSLALNVPSHGMKTGDYVTCDGRISFKEGQVTQRVYETDAFWVRTIDDDNVELYDTRQHANDPKSHQGRIQIDSGIFKRQNTNTYGRLMRARLVVGAASQYLIVKNHGLSTGDQVVYTTAEYKEPACFFSLCYVSVKPVFSCIQEIVDVCWLGPCYSSSFSMGRHQTNSCLKKGDVFFVRNRGPDKVELYRSSASLAGAVSMDNSIEHVQFKKKDEGEYGFLLRVTGVPRDVTVNKGGHGYKAADKISIKLGSETIARYSGYIVNHDEGSLDAMISAHDVATSLGKFTRLTTSDFELFSLYGLILKAASALFTGTTLSLNLDYLSTAALSLPNALQFRHDCIKYKDALSFYGMDIRHMLDQLRVYHWYFWICTIFIVWLLALAKCLLACIKCCCRNMFAESSQCDCPCVPVVVICCLSWLLFVIGIAIGLVVVIAVLFFGTVLAILGIPNFVVTVALGFHGNVVQKLNALLQLWTGVENAYYNLYMPVKYFCDGRNGKHGTYVDICDAECLAESGRPEGS